MATYDFATITAQQALDIQASDELRFTGGPARDASVIYHTVGDSLDPTGFTITFAGRAVDFGPALLDLGALGHLSFADRSLLAIGGSHNDSFDGGPDGFALLTGGNDAFFGGGGDDVLFGEGLDDAMQGNQGNDTIVTDAGADVLYGGQGNDRLTTGLGNASDKGDFAHGNLGNDTIQGGAGSDTLLGGQGEDSIDGGVGADVLNGNLGNDILVSHGAARMFGEDGSDTLSAQAPGAVLTGGAGADLFVLGARSGAFLGQTATVASTITDWQSTDHLHIEGQSFATVPANYTELLVADTGDPTLNLGNAFDAASLALFTEGAQTIAVQIAGSVVIFADTDVIRGLEVGVLLVGRTLADISAANFI